MKLTPEEAAAIVREAGEVSIQRNLDEERERVEERLESLEPAIGQLRQSVLAGWRVTLVESVRSDPEFTMSRIVYTITMEKR